MINKFEGYINFLDNSMVNPLQRLLGQYEYMKNKTKYFVIKYDTLENFIDKCRKIDH